MAKEASVPIMSSWLRATSSLPSPSERASFWATRRRAMACRSRTRTDACQASPDPVRTNEPGAGGESDSGPSESRVAT